MICCRNFCKWHIVLLLKESNNNYNEEYLGFNLALILCPSLCQMCGIAILLHLCHMVFICCCWCSFQLDELILSSFIRLVWHYSVSDLREVKAHHWAYKLWDLYFYILCKLKSKSLTISFSQSVSDTCAVLVKSKSERTRIFNLIKPHL
jgi:hypothetical protein